MVSMRLAVSTVTCALAGNTASAHSPVTTVAATLRITRIAFPRPTDDRGTLRKSPRRRKLGRPGRNDATPEPMPNRPSSEFALDPADAERLANLAGPFDAHLRQLELRLGVEIGNRGNIFRIAGPEAAVQLGRAS